MLRTFAPGAVSIALLLAITACGDATTKEIAAEAAANSRLIVLDASGDLVTIRPDGTEPQTLVDAPPTGLTLLQPTWSTDGTRVAWTEVDTEGDEPGFYLVSSLIDGSAETRAPLDFPPFYLMWDPTSARIAYLGTGLSGLEMGLVDIASGGKEAGTIDGGAPYYLSWSPDGESLIVHAEARRLDFLDLDGNRTPVGDEPGVFNAPVWSKDGSKLIYARSGVGDQRVVVSDAEGDKATEVARFEGFISFLLSPVGDRIALQAGGQGTDPPGVSALAPRPGGQAVLTALRAQEDVPRVALGLSVIDLGSGEVATVTEEPVVAYFWSPDGSRLLALLFDREDDQTWFRWLVWEDGPVMTTERFFPSENLLSNYLPFFDQYAQSLTLWAPDASAFTYAGRDVDGTVGVWVQEVGDGQAPKKITDGTFSSWSP